MGYLYEKMKERRESLDEHMERVHGFVSEPIECPVCAKRRRRKKEQMKRYRKKLKGIKDEP